MSSFYTCENIIFENQTLIYKLGCQIKHENKTRGAV